MRIKTRVHFTNNLMGFSGAYAKTISLHDIPSTTTNHPLGDVPSEDSVSKRQRLSLNGLL